VLPSIHDHTLLGYRVSLVDSEVALRTVPDQRACADPVFEREVVFEGCVAHNFEHVSEGTILGWLLEVPLEQFVAAHGAQFEEGWRQSGWPPWWHDSAAKALAYLQQRDVHAFEITSSYGMGGWVLARSVRTSPAEPTEA
jgi:hypothetical protein